MIIALLPGLSEESDVYKLYEELTNDYRESYDCQHVFDKAWISKQYKVWYNTPYKVWISKQYKVWYISLNTEVFRDTDRDSIILLGLIFSVEYSNFEVPTSE